VVPLEEVFKVPTAAESAMLVGFDDEDDENNAFWTAWKFEPPAGIEVFMPLLDPLTSTIPLDETPSDGDGYKHETREWNNIWSFTTAVMAGISCGVGKVVRVLGRSWASTTCLFLTWISSKL
jgi:hypothetical protein